MATAVWCLIIDYKHTPLGRPFKVFPESDTNDIADLKKKVKAENPIVLKDVDASQLRVWRSAEASLPPNGDSDHLKALIKAINFRDRTKIVELGSPDTIESLELDKKNETLLVQMPDVRGSKRKREDPEFPSIELEQRKRNRLATEAPSSNATFEKYEKMQLDPNENILDDRPEPDCDMPPISLLYDGFGLFLDIIDGRRVDGLSEYDAFETIKAVDQFADAMCKFYPSEDARRDAGLAGLNKILATRKEILPYQHLRAVSVGSVRTDGHSNGPHNITSKIMEFNNRITGICVLPDAELVSYFAHSQKAAISSLANAKLFCGWRIPCMGIVIVGCEVRFYAMLTLGPKFRLVSLTPSISCIKTASDGRERTALRTAFMAACVLQDSIYADAKNHLSSLSPTVHHDMTPPYLPAITKIGTFEIHDLELWPKHQPYRYLYHAKNTSGDHIVVKFSPQYSAELHRFCSDRGHAPALLACERLPGGWYGIVMQYLPDIEPISLSPHLKMHYRNWATQLEELVQSFHTRGLVHGDLRDANIVCNAEGKMWLIDFDWGGKDGQVSYPTADLHLELLDGRNSDSLAITKADDVRVLNITLVKVAQNLTAGL